MPPRWSCENGLEHSCALAAKRGTIAVIGTPLGQVYPKANALQEKIARDHLLISQVPVKRYDAQNFRTNRFFPRAQQAEVRTHHGDGHRRSGRRQRISGRHEELMV
jgi:hypothetical protein